MVSRTASSPEQIRAWHNIHRGRPCCIIGNGPSIKRVDLTQIDIPTFGLNKAWMLGEWSYYVIGDQSQFDFYNRTAAQPLSALEPLFTLEDGPAHATRIQTLRATSRAFSFDLVEGMHPNNTVCAFAIQLAIWMGFYTIYLVGIDGQGNHFDGGDDIPARKFANQREAYGYIAGLLDGVDHPTDIINLSPETRVFAFPKQKFEFVFGPKARRKRPRTIEV